MGRHSIPGFWGFNDMKRLVFVIGGVAALAVSACSGDNQDAVNNAELNQPAAEDLNALANEAANNAADLNAGANEQVANDMNAVGDNGENPTEAEEQNVSGM
jgi:hypothetical protein